MRTRPGIPTTYESSNFRSRLEARWAAFFDLIGWRYTYEPFAVRPCGRYPGGHIHPVRVDIERLWREAGNRTQWRAA